MYIPATNKNYSDLSTQDILELTVNLLVDEQLRNKNNGRELERVYSILSRRKRLDIYNDATTIATKKAADLSEVLYEFQNYEIKELVPVLVSDVKKKIQKSSDSYKELSVLDFAPFLTNEKNICTVIINGDSMIGADIHDGDEAIVLQNEKVKNNDIVIVDFEGVKLIKRYVEKDRKKWLVSENANYSPIEITEEYSVTFIGVIKSVIHKVY